MTEIKDTVKEGEMKKLVGVTLYLPDGRVLHINSADWDNQYFWTDGFVKVELVFEE